MKLHNYFDVRVLVAFLNPLSCVSGQGSSLIICVGILTGYTDTLQKMLTQLSGMSYVLTKVLLLFKLGGDFVRIIIILYQKLSCFKSKK